jgi:hypothetical protein
VADDGREGLSAGAPTSVRSYRPLRVRRGVAVFRLRGLRASAIRSARLQVGRRRTALSLRGVRRGAQRGRLELKLARRSAGRPATISSRSARAARLRVVVAKPAPSRPAPARPAARPSAPSPRPVPSRRPAPSAAKTPPAPAARELLFGFNDNSVLGRRTTAAQDADLNARIGANVVRATFDWRWAEPKKDDYRLGTYDEIYRESLARGVRPVFIVLFAPSWALDPSTPCNQWGADCRLPPGREYDGELAEMAAIIARRYPRSAGIEIWNEPNQNHFWKSGPDPVRYTEMLKASYRAVKAVDPSLPVAGASIADNPSTRDGIPPRPYLEGMYRSGAKGHMDALSFHPYPHATGLLDRTFADVRAVRDAYGDDSTPLWVTETGWTTSGQQSSWPSSWILSEQDQATALVGLYTKISAMPDVEALMFHTLVEPKGDSLTNSGVGYGIVRGDLTPKPAYCALARVRGKTGACGS